MQYKDGYNFYIIKRTKERNNENIIRLHKTLSINHIILYNYLK